MKKLFLLTLFFSMGAWAEKPLPEACQTLIQKSEEAFLIAEKQDPSQSVMIRQKRKILAEIKREWWKLQKLDLPADATEQEKTAALASQQEREKSFIANCEKNLEIAEKVLQEE